MINQPSVLGAIRVLEIGGVASVPYCGRLLSMLGAEVIKIESPGGDRVARHLPPILSRMPAMERSAMFYYLNAGKSLITADVSTPSGSELVRQLIERSDVVVHSCAELATVKLGPEMLNSYGDIVQCAITPFGWVGPSSNYPSSDLVVNAVGGDMYLTPAGLAHSMSPESEPLKLAGFSASYGAGIVAAMSIVASLMRRLVGLGGDFIDVSEQDVQISMSREQIMWAANENVLETRDTRAMPVGGCFECRDGHIQIYVFSDAHWIALRETMGNPEWAESEKFSTPLLRASNASEINSGIALWAKGSNRDPIYEMAKKFGATIAPFLSPIEILDDLHEADREFFVDAVLPNGDIGKVPRRPFLMTETPSEWRSGSITPGAHNRHVYSKIGLSERDIDILMSAGVI